MIGLLCKRALQKRLYSAKETWILNQLHTRDVDRICMHDMNASDVWMNAMSHAWYQWLPPIYTYTRHSYVYTSTLYSLSSRMRIIRYIHEILIEYIFGWYEDIMHFSYKWMLISHWCNVIWGNAADAQHVHVHAYIYIYIYIYMYTYIALSDVSAACTRRITLWYECVRQCDIDRIYAHDMNASHSVNVIWMNAHLAHCLIQRDLSECRNALHVHVHRQRRSDSKQLRLPKYPTSFHGSPRTYETRFHGSPQIFKQVFTQVNGVPVTQNRFWENRENLDIQILVWSPPWATSELMSCDSLFTCMLWLISTLSRLFKITGLFCKRALYKRRYSAKETYILKCAISHYSHVCCDSDRWRDTVMCVVWLIYLFHVMTHL